MSSSSSSSSSTDVQEPEFLAVKVYELEGDEDLLGGVDDLLEGVGIISSSSSNTQEEVYSKERIDLNYSANFNINFQTDSIRNIMTFYTPERSQNLLHIYINSEELILPVEVAISISSFITNKLIVDPTNQRFDIEIPFRNKSIAHDIISIFNNPDYLIVFDSFDKVYDFALFGAAFQCASFCEPMIQYILQHTDNKELEIDRILDKIFMKLLLNKQPFKVNQLLNFNINDEIAYLASNFYSICEDDSFIKWCQNKNNLDLLELILDNPGLCVKSEDSLVEFIIPLCELDTDYEILFKYIYFEYCYDSSVQKVVEYTHNDSFNNLRIGQKSLIECILRRCTKLKNNLDPPYISNRHKYPKESDENINQT